MTLLDGNALAGRLAEVLGGDATDSPIRCRHCGEVGELGRVVVFATAMGLVARCRGCDGVLLTLVHADDGRAWFGMPGLSALPLRGR